jgi:hypothetical protein
MKKIILLLLAIALTSCDLLAPAKPAGPPKPVTVQTDNYKAKSIEYITGELHTSGRSLGLYKVTLEDGREVLLYNDAKGIAMIQLIK